MNEKQKKKNRYAIIIFDPGTPFSQPWRPVGARPRPGIRFG